MEITPAAGLRLFLLDKEDANLRATSLSYYRFAIQRFIDGLGAPTCSAITSADLREFTAAMRARGLKPSAIRSYQGAVWTWIRWLHEQDEFGVADVTRRVKLVTVRNEDVTRRTATDGMRKTLIQLARARAEHPRRNTAIIEALWSSGARRSELAACMLHDFDEVAGTLLLRHTKSGNPRLVAVERSARIAIAQYIARERAQMPVGPLFLGRGRQPLTGNGIASVVQSLAESAKFVVTPHDFRRAAAARWLKAGAPLDVVMSQLGHDDSSMSLLYGREGRESRAISIIHDIDSGVRSIWRGA